MLDKLTKWLFCTRFVYFSRHHLDEFVVVDLAVAVLVGLPDHPGHLILREGRAEPLHHLISVCIIVSM